MLTIGDKFPAISVPVQQGTNALPAGETLDLTTAFPGKWKVLFYWPKDFTFVCPTEIVGYSQLQGDFADRPMPISRRPISRGSPTMARSWPMRWAFSTRTSMSRSAPPSSSIRTM